MLDDEFVAAARAFLEGAAPAHRAPPVSEQTAHRVALFPDLSPEEERAELGRALPRA